jgi:hypothetical protein
MTYPEKIWIGSGFKSSGIFILGQSWYGHYEDELATDDGYIRAYLKDLVQDAAYDRWARASKCEKVTFWNNVMFTNYVQWTGPKRDPGPTAKHYKGAVNRLAAILQDHQINAVWIIGKTQSKYSRPVIDALGISCEVTAIRASDSEFEEAWKAISKPLPCVATSDA